MKKISLFLILILLCSLSLVGCNRSNPVADFKYSTYDGEIYITRYLGDSKNVVIPETIDNMPVVEIGASAFMDTNIESVTISDSVRIILDYAFCGCKSLKNVSFGKKVEHIGANAFMDCVKLKKIVLENGVKTLGVDAFLGCSSVKEIHIPKTLENCGLTSFASNTALTSIVFEDGIKTIDGYASFNRASSLKEITIPASVEKISDAVFMNCINLKKIYFLGNAPTEIGFNAFGKNEGVEIYYPKNASGWDNIALSKEYTLIAR